MHSVFDPVFQGLTTMLAGTHVQTASSWKRKFEALYGEHRDGVYRYLLALSGDARVAEELSAETWAALFFSEDKGVNKSLRLFLFGIARHKWIDWVRSRPRSASQISYDDCDGSIVELHGTLGPTHTAAKSQALQLLRNFLGKLPYDQAEALLLHHGLGHSIADVGEIQGVNAETAKSRIRYGVKKMRTLAAADAQCERLRVGD